MLHWPTLHLQVVQGDLGICHVSPLRRAMPAGSLHVCRMSYDRLSARQGSVTQRGQHSPSATAVYSHINVGQTRGQQSTSPSCRDTGSDEKKHQNCYSVCEFSFLFFLVCVCVWDRERIQLQISRWSVATSLIREVVIFSALIHTQLTSRSGSGMN